MRSRDCVAVGDYHGREVAGTYHRAGKQLVYRSRGVDCLELVAHYTLAVGDVGVNSALACRLVRAVAVDNHFKFRGFSVNRFVPLDCFAVLALMGRIVGVLTVEEVDFDAGYAEACPFLKLAFENNGVAVAEVGERVAPHDDLYAGVVRVVHKRLEIDVPESCVPAAVEKDVLPAHIRGEVDVFAMQRVVGLRTRSVIGEPAPSNYAVLYPIVIVDFLFLVREGIVIVRFPILGVVVDLFDELGFLHRFHVAGDTDAPGRSERVFDFVVV